MRQTVGVRCGRARRGVALLLMAVAAAGCASGPRRTAAPAPSGGADQSASGDLARGRPVARAEELFEGRFPGVQVYRAPGGIIVRVRGGSTMSGSGEPLYVIDGFPRQPGTGGLLDINPNDIARIEVLKDPTSLAEYGSRGGNGVVRVTTKKGR